MEKSEMEKSENIKRCRLHGNKVKNDFFVENGKIYCNFCYFNAIECSKYNGSIINF